MKPQIIPMIRTHLILGVSMLLAGCAQFQHQTGETEPHALVTIMPPGNPPGAHGVVKSLDGLPVSAGQTYRVRPGSHAVQIEFVETVSETSKPYSATLFQAGNAPMPPEQPANIHLSQSGGMSVTGQQPFTAMQPANLTVEDRRTRTATRTITVLAGWRYELDGSRITEKPRASR